MSVPAPPEAIRELARRCASVKFAIIVVGLIAWPALRFTAR